MPQKSIKTNSWLNNIIRLIYHIYKFINNLNVGFLYLLMKKMLNKHYKKKGCLTSFNNKIDIEKRNITKYRNKIDIKVKYKD